MMFNNLRSLAVGVAAMAVAGLAMGAETTAVKINTGGMEATIGGEFRADLTHDNHGLGKTTSPEYNPSKTTTFATHVARVLWEGKLDANTEYHLAFNVLGNSDNIVANATWWHSKMLGFSIGRMKVNQGGWDHKGGEWNTVIDNLGSSAYQLGETHAGNEDGLAIHVNAFGNLTLQLVNDVVAGTGGFAAGRKNTEAKQPAMVLEWTGDFSGIMPIVQVGSFDLNNSKFFDVGAKTSMSNVGIQFDYMASMISQAGTSATTGEAKRYTHNVSNITLAADYTMKGLVKPFFYFNSFDVKQPAEDGNKDLTGNSTTIATAATPAAYNFDDNGSVIGFGAWCLATGNYAMPYAAVTMRSGKWLKVGSTETEAKNDMTMKVGLAAKF